MAVGVARDCMTAAGVVVRAAGAQLTVELAPAAGCRGCRGLCMWRLQRRSETLAIAADRDDFVPGDRVLVALPDRYVLRGALLLHGLPLAALLGGAFAGAALGQSDLAALAGAVAGVAAALGATPRLRARLEQAVTANLELRRDTAAEATAADAAEGL
jgi:positive regulator of sigma E activity